VSELITVVCPGVDDEENGLKMKESVKPHIPHSSHAVRFFKLTALSTFGVIRAFDIITGRKGKCL
jgi:hypothetical protein